MTKAHLEKAEILGPLMKLEATRLAFAANERALHLHLGAKLRGKRVECGVSVREMARRIGFSAAYVSDVETGRRNVTIAFADAFMEALDR